MSSVLTLPAIIPVRNAADEQLAVAARASVPLQAARRLADWFGDQPVDAELGWRSASAQRDAAMAVGLVTADEPVTGETIRLLHWLFAVAFHAGYVHLSDDHDQIYRCGELADGTVRSDQEIIADWTRALDALYGHGLEHVLPEGVSPAPLDFEGIGNYPIFKLVEQHGSASIAAVSAMIAERAAEGMTPSAGRAKWRTWTAEHGDPTGPFLRLAAEFGVVAIDGSTVAITPLAASAVIREAGAKTEMMPPSAEMTARQLIICKLGLSAGAYAEERQAWLATRDPAEAVSSLLAVASDAAADGNFAYLTAAVEIAAGIQGDTETAWRSATGLPGIRPYAVAELNRRAGRNPQRNPLPGLEPGPCDAVTIASDAVLACYAAWSGADTAAELARVVRQAAAPASEAALFEQMWRSRHAASVRALKVIGQAHPDKKIAKAARAAVVKAASAAARC